MSLTTKKSEGGNFDPCPEGVHIAICYGLYDLGTQHNQRFDKYQEKVLVVWELPDERMMDGRPFSLSKRYTNSLHEKAQLRKDLEAWRGRAFTEAELEGFDLRNILSANCQIQVIHNQQGDKTYVNIASIMALPKGMAIRKPENPIVSYELGGELPEAAPDWIKEIIKSSQEWKAQSPPYNGDEYPHIEDEVEPF